MKDNREEDFIRFARHTLEQDLQGMDAVTCSRLARARAQAVATATHRWQMRIVPMASLAVAAALLIFLWPVAQGPDTQQLALEDIDILASDADMDVLADPDFYRWLASYPTNSLPLRGPPMGQGKARSAANGESLVKGRNAGLAHWRTSLRAELNGRSAALRSLELATANPAFARLAEHPVQYRWETTNLWDRTLKNNNHAG